MSVQLKDNGNRGLIQSNGLRDGQLAVVENSPNVRSYEGRVVQRIGDRLYTIGQSQGCSWQIAAPTFGLRLLEVGEQIEVTGN